MFAEAVLGMERGGVAVAWSLCPIFRRREDLVKGLAGLKELRVKEARARCQLSAVSIGACRWSSGIATLGDVMRRCALRR
jgi:hypothetical protein